MVSRRGRALVDARAAGTNPEQVLEGRWPQMLRFDVIGSVDAGYHGIAVSFILSAAGGGVAHV